MVENLPTQALPFAGLKVIDCASFIAGPAAATILADFGADVIKIEPLEGDPYRGLYRVPGSPASDANYPWELDSRNKRSLAIDLKRLRGVAVLHRLVAQADVFITNLPLPARARLAIDHASLAPLNARLIYASLTAYGESGSEAAKPGFDATAYWARSGLMDLIRPDHTAPPARAVAGLGDHPTATALFAAIATALYRRERTGQGGLVSTSLLANGLWANGVQVQATLGGVVYPPRPPRHQAPNALANVYRCADGRWLNLVILNEQMVPALLHALGDPSLLNDARLTSPALRGAHNLEAIALLDFCFAQHSLATWRVKLDAAGVTFGIINTLAEVAFDEQARQAQALVPFADGDGWTVASPLQLQGVQQRSPERAPYLGQHSAQVLHQAGYTSTDIAQLIDEGIVLDGTDPSAAIAQ